VKRANTGPAVGNLLHMLEKLSSLMYAVIKCEVKDG